MLRRIVSLLPAATEIVGALGMMDHMVGVSHECNYPVSAQTKPRITHCEIADDRFSSAEIDRWVSQKLSVGEDLFVLDETKLRELQPDLILTQRLCDVCAPAYGSVMALAETLSHRPTVLNLEPNTLADVFRDIQRVADALDVSQSGVRLLQSLNDRVEYVKNRVAGVACIPRVVVIEWLDPVFCSGHWTPELVTFAGGREVLGQHGKDSVRKSWAEVRAAEAEILVVACCGQSADRAVRDWEQMQENADIQALPAVQSGRVYFVDGDAYFSRPGPRLVDSLEILAQLIHPDLFAGAYPERGVKRLAAVSPLFSR